MSRILNILGTSVKQLLGALFVFSALSKFVAIDQFNVYVFSYGFLSLNLSIVLGWLVVSSELLLAMFMLNNRHHSLVSWGNIAMLVGFSFFLIYAQLMGRTDSCHCLGEMLPFNPMQSLVKNLVLLLFSLFALRHADADWQPRWWLSLLVMLVPVGLFVWGAFAGWTRMTVIDFRYTMVLAGAVLAATVLSLLPFVRWTWARIVLAMVPFVMVMVLNTYASLFFHKGTTRFDGQLFEEVLREDDQLADAQLNQGHQMVALFSPTCPYCRMAAQKMSLIVGRHQLPIDRVTVLFPGDSIVSHPDFFESTNSPEYRQLALDATNYVKVTYGQLPVVVLLQDGEVYATYDHANLSEKAIVEWLTINQ